MPRRGARAPDGTGLVDLAAPARDRTARVRTVAVRVTIGLAAGALLTVTFLRLVGVSAVYQIELIQIGSQKRRRLLGIPVNTPQPGSDKPSERPSS